VKIRPRTFLRAPTFLRRDSELREEKSWSGKPDNYDDGFAALAQLESA